MVLLAYGALGIAGWGIGRSRSPAHPLSTGTEPPSKTERVSAPRMSKAAEDLLDRVYAARAKSAVAREQAEHEKIAKEKQRGEDVRERFRSLPEAADPEAAFHAALAKIGEGKDAQLDAAARFIQWAQRDPEAALSTTKQGAAARGLDYDDEALEEVGKLVPAKTLLGLLHKDLYYDPLLKGCVQPLIANLDTAGLVEFLKDVPEEFEGSFHYHLRTQWPKERRGDFDALALALDDVKMFTSFGETWENEEEQTWLFKATERLDNEDFARRVRASSDYRMVLTDAVHLPLEARLAAAEKRGPIGDGGQILSRHGVLERSAGKEVGEFLDGVDGPDYLYAFHHGRIGADELLEKLKARFPRYAEEGMLAPEQIYNALAVEEPARAAALLAGLPEEERSLAMAKAIDYRFDHVSLDRVATAIRLIPALTDDEGVMKARQEIWEKLRDDGLKNYGASYLEWADSLPDLRDREMLTEAIIGRLGGSSLWHGREIRRVIGGEIQFPLRP